MEYNIKKVLDLTFSNLNKKQTESEINKNRDTPKCDPVIVYEFSND